MVRERAICCGHTYADTKLEWGDPLMAQLILGLGRQFHQAQQEAFLPLLLLLQECPHQPRSVMDGGANGLRELVLG